ncbi:hypothetical protein IQ07DRAFT_638877 [Pyrenochaeta sp. DS3sAY3a]|nr:hypothetical protein IQ07DRAFT_638877 [Pyrenochaeta sp. DS3sAY3a]
MFHSHIFGRDVHQDICVVNVDPEKLMAKLKDRYGTEFQIHMIHNVYSIRASGHFSQADLDDLGRGDNGLETT